MNVYPVGAVWTASNKRGRGRVWLERRDGNLEVWFYEFRYDDDKIGDRDWATSRRKAVELCQVLMYEEGTKVRFKREREPSRETDC